MGFLKATAVIVYTKQPDACNGLFYIKRGWNEGFRVLNLALNFVQSAMLYAQYLDYSLDWFWA